MAVTLASKRLISNIFKLAGSFQSKHFNVMVQMCGTHKYDAIDYSVTAKNMQEFIDSPNILNEISKRTGAVIRVKVNEEDHNLLIVGNPFQLKGATRHIKAFLDGTNLSKSDNDISTEEADTRLIWHGYKRNFKGQYAPAKPRKKCIRCGGKMISGNPCPLCQLKIKSNYDVHYTDVEILKQFICPHTWQILDPFITGICKNQQRIVEGAITNARLHGYIPFTLPLPIDGPGKHTPAGVPTDRRIKVKMH